MNEQASGIREQQRKQLGTAGFLALENSLEAEEVRQFQEVLGELFDKEGDSAGSEFRQEVGCRRLANLVDKAPCFRDLIVDPRLTAWVSCVLGNDWKLSSLNARAVLPGSNIRQPLHADMGAVPDSAGDWVCNLILLLDDVCAENGPIRVVPGSHRSGMRPDQALEDCLADHPDEVHVVGNAGTMVVLNAHVWHGGLPNRSASPRTALHVFYTRGDHPQQQYQRKLLSPATIHALTVQQRRVLALDDPRNDDLAAQSHRQSGFLPK